MRSTTGWSERSTPKCQNIPTRPLSDAHRAQATSVRKYGPPLGATVRKCLPTSARPQHTPPPAPPRLTETNQTFRGMHHDRSNTESTSRAFATHLRRALATALALLSDHGRGLSKKIAFLPLIVTITRRAAARPAGAYAGTPRTRMGASELPMRSGMARISSSMCVIGPLRARGKNQLRPGPAPGLPSHQPACPRCGVSRPGYWGPQQPRECRVARRYSAKPLFNCPFYAEVGPARWPKNKIWPSRALHHQNGPPGAPWGRGGPCRPLWAGTRPGRVPG